MNLLKRIMQHKIKFTRIGGLSPVVQKGYTTDPEKRGYHTPPARKGLYAFIHPHFEGFLLGGTWSKLGKNNAHEKFEYVKDKDGNKIKYYKDDYPMEKVLENEMQYLNPKILKHLIKGKHSNVADLTWKYWTEDIRDEKGDFVNSFLIKKKKLKVFYHTGELWHHLKNSAVKQFEIISEVMSYNSDDGAITWIKTDYDVFVRAYEQDKINCVKQLRSDKNYPITQIEINTKNIYNHISKDHLEVFIERIK